jgi:hypothetical protein
VEGLTPPLHIWAACGFGRSFASTTWVPFRSLPGILECGLWDALAAEPSLAGSKRPLALITDVGNDLLYGVEVPQILSWVDECTRRLAGLGAQLAITLPPLARLKLLSNWRFVATRSLFFPMSGLTRARMFGDVERLCEGLGEIAARHSANVVVPELEWYGIDPIHLRRSRRAAAWKIIAGGWPDFAAEATNRWDPASTEWPGFFWWPVAARRRVLGCDRTVAQPSFRREGLAISLY